MLEPAPVRLHRAVRDRPQAIRPCPSPSSCAAGYWGFCRRRAAVRRPPPLAPQTAGWRRGRRRRGRRTAAHRLLVCLALFCAVVSCQCFHAGQQEDCDMIKIDIQCLVKGAVTNGSPLIGCIDLQVESRLQLLRRSWTAQRHCLQLQHHPLDCCAPSPERPQNAVPAWKLRTSPSLKFLLSCLPEMEPRLSIQAHHVGVAKNI